MSTISTSFPDSTYTEANPPSAGTLKADISAIEIGHNAHEADTDNPHSVTIAQVGATTEAYVDAAILACKQALFPVGSVYTNESVATNPATLLGFGTWEAYGAGRVVVGKAGSGTFDTAGATGGAETVTLTSAQSGLPAHNHIQDAHGHKIATEGGRSNNTDSNSGKYAWNDPTYGALATRTTHLENTVATNQANSASNASSAHNNLQPYIVAYMWKRTA